jgi:hypothetical protein
LGNGRSNRLGWKALLDVRRRSFGQRIAAIPSGSDLVSGDATAPRHRPEAGSEEESGQP